MMRMSLRKLIQKIVYRLRGELTVDTLIKMGLTVGKNFVAQQGANLDPSHCWLITIGDDVTLAPRVQILAHDASTCKHLGYAKIGRVVIGNRVFIGAGTIILPDVRIGDDVIIGAGSVVTRSLESGAVYAGNPAQKVCTIEEYVGKHQRKMESRPVYGGEFTLRQNISAQMKLQQRAELEDGIGYVK